MTIASITSNTNTTYPHRRDKLPVTICHLLSPVLIIVDDGSFHCLPAILFQPGQHLEIENLPVFMQPVWHQECIYCIHIQYIRVLTMIKRDSTRCDACGAHYEMTNHKDRCPVCCPGQKRNDSNLDELIEGVQILFDPESMTPADPATAARMVSQIREMKGDQGLSLLRAVARGELAAVDAIEALNASMSEY